MLMLIPQEGLKMIVKLLKNDSKTPDTLIPLKPFEIGVILSENA